MIVSKLHDRDAKARACIGRSDHFLFASQDENCTLSAERDYSGILLG